MKLGNKNNNKLYIGNDAVNKMYIGNTLEYDNSLWTLNDTTVFAWYDMMQGVVNAGAGKVSAWNDAMGTAERNITAPSTGNRRPTITADGVEFNGTSEFLSNINPFMYGKTEGVHIIAIMSAPESGGVAKRGISEANSVNNIQNYSLLCQDNDTGNHGKITQAMRDNSAFDTIIFGGNTRANIAWDNINFKMIEHIDTTSQIKTAINCDDADGTPITYERPEVRISPAPPVPAMTLNTFAIGAMDRLADASFMQMKIKSLVILPGDITTDIRQRTQGYLAHRYSLTSLLPNAHPYKTNPPTR